MDLSELISRALDAGVLSMAAGENVLIEIETMRDIGEVTDTTAKSLLKDHV